MRTGGDEPLSRRSSAQLLRIVRGIQSFKILCRLAHDSHSIFPPKVSLCFF